MTSILRKKKLMAEINVVPYIDVMLVLLIIFMVTAPLLTQGIKVELPQAGTEPISESTNTPLILSVDAEGNLYINVGDNEDKPVISNEIISRTRAVLRIIQKH
jgi:biopolymer transport protein TolR